MLMNAIELAEYSLVHDYVGPNGLRGAVALAAITGFNAATLSNKVNPAMPVPKLSNQEAVLVQHAARDHRILHADAAALGHTCIPLGVFDDVSDLELLTLYARLHSQIGDHAAALLEALRDGRVTRKEVTRIETEWLEVVQAGAALVARLKGIVDD